MRQLSIAARLARAGTCLLVLAAAACGPASVNDRGDSDSDDIPGAHLELTPATSTLELSGGIAQQLTFTAEYVAENGDRRDATGETTFDVSTLFGHFDGATFTTNGGAGIATVTAVDPDGVMGEASITILLDAVRVDPSAPANAADLFGAATEGQAGVPALAYPPAGAVMPPNIGEFETHWNDGQGHDLFEVTLASDYATLRVYVGGAGTNFLQFFPTEWANVVGNSDQVTTQVRALTQAAPATYTTSELRTVALTNQDITGGMYYWASTSAVGAAVFRHDLATPGVAPEPFLIAANSPNSCVGCHALSRSGERMAVTYGGNGPATLIDVASRTPIVATTQYWNFATYAPEEDVLATVENGTLVLRDATTAAELSTIHDANSGTVATHPDFAPDGSALAYTLATSGYYDFQVDGGSIYTRSYDATSETFGAETLLFDCGGANCYYPSYSPDSQWLLFTQVSAGNSYDNPDAMLWAVRADGSSPPVAMGNASIAGKTNSWSRWAPFAQTLGESGEAMFWVTFSSRRDFGVRLVGIGRPQVWMAPFFPGRAAQGMDPAGVPFRLPFQDIASSNHIAQWTEQVVILD